MNRRVFPLASLALSLLAACGSPDEGAAATAFAPQREAQALSRIEGAPAPWQAPLHDAALDGNVWQHRAASCSTTRNACIDLGGDLLLPDGTGKLTLHATAGSPATAQSPRIPARYPSVDLVAPEGSVVAGRCLELTLTLPQDPALHGGVVLAPEADAAFTGQIYVASATAGLLRMGLACPGGTGSISFARPAGSAFVQAPHLLRFCADAHRATWHLDGDLWAEVTAEEMTCGCGVWPFGEQASPLHPHFALTPTGGFHQATPAGDMVLQDVRVLADQ